MSRTDPQVNFRLPQELRDKLSAASKASGRTLTAEIVARLEGSFRLPDMIDKLEISRSSLETEHHSKSELITRLVDLYEAQKALSDLQQEIIRQLSKDEPRPTRGIYPPGEEPNHGPNAKSIFPKK